MLRSLLLIAAMAGYAAPACAASPVFDGPLYDHSAVGSEGWNEPREAVSCNGAVSVYNNSQPRIEVFLPEAGIATGTGVILLPGGALRLIGVGAESDAEVDALLAHGIVVVRLEYRTLQVPAGSIRHECAPPSASAPPIRFPKLEIRNGNANPAPDNPKMREVLDLATADAQECLRLMRRRAGEWKLDPQRIGMIGTSAGGGVAFGTLFAQAPAEAKPDFLVSIFGPSLQDAVVPLPAPPLFLVTEADHGPVTDGLLAMYRIWKDAGARAELHVYDVPVFSMTVDLWGPRLFDWMRERSLLPKDENK
jgi:dienelactone hydrolase